MSRIYKVKKSKPDSVDKKELKSDRTWGGKNILTGEPVEKDKGSMPPGWKHAESHVDAEGYVNCFCDGRRIARYPTEETAHRLRKEAATEPAE